MGEVIADAAVRRKLRQKLGSRYTRRAGTKSDSKNHPRPRQRLAELIEEWKRDQCLGRDGV